MRQNQRDNNVYNIDIITNLGNITNIIVLRYIIVGNTYDYLENIIRCGLIIMFLQPVCSTKHTLIVPYLIKKSKEKK